MVYISYDTNVKIFPLIDRLKSTYNPDREQFLKKEIQDWCEENSIKCAVDIEVRSPPTPDNRRDVLSLLHLKWIYRIAFLSERDAALFKLFWL